MNRDRLYKEYHARTAHDIKEFNSKENTMRITASGQLQKELDVIFGLREPDSSCKNFDSFADLYRYYTGDLDLQGKFVRSQLPGEMRAAQDITSDSFPLALANSLNQTLSAGYNKKNYFENALISSQKPSKDLRQNSFVQVGNIEDLPGIDPETEDYPDMPKLNENRGLFNMLQKGCVIPFSRRVYYNDRLGLIKVYMSKLGEAAKKVHARYVWNFFINNANCNDGTSWFSADHGNTGSQALSIPYVKAAIDALVAMTEFGTTDLMCFDLSNFKWHLVVAPPLWGTAVQINQTRSYYTSNDLTSKTCNPCYHLFGEKNERIVTPPFLTDTNDWGVLRSPEEVPIVEMKYLHGRKEPEIIFSPHDLQEMSFVRDRFPLKCLFEFGGTLSDYRGGYKAEVA